MTVLQTIRPTLFALPLTTRRKGQGPKAKPADKIQDFGHSIHATCKDRALAVLQNGMPPVFHIGVLQIFQRSRSRGTTKLWNRWKTGRRRQFLHRPWLQLRLGRHRFRLCVHRRRFHRRVCQLRSPRLRFHRVRIYLRRRVAIAESEMMASGTSRHTL